MACLLAWVLLLNGLLVMVGLQAHLRWLVWADVGHVAMVFNTGLCFFLLGLAMVLPANWGWSAVICQRLVAAVVGCIGFLTLTEWVAGVSLGIDTLFHSPWVLDPSPVAGRMALNTAIGFVLSALALFFLSCRYSPFQKVIFYVLLVIIGLQGWVAIIGYVLGLEFLYEWYLATIMSLHTACCFVLLSVTLCFKWYEVSKKNYITPGGELTRVLLNGFVVLSIMICFAAFSGFKVYLEHVRPDVIRYRSAPNHEERVRLESIIIEPIRSQFEEILVILGASLFVGGGLIYSQIVMLVRRGFEARKAVENQLREANELFQSAFGDAPIGTILVSPVGKILNVNSAFVNLLGYTENELLKKSVLDITAKEDIESSREYIKKVVDEGLKPYPREKRYVSKAGAIVWVLLTTSLVRNNQGEPLYFVGHIQDITNERRNREQLNFIAHHDALTGLDNRVELDKKFDLLSKNAQRQKTNMAVVFLDIDDFKQVNDRYGHASGDVLLKQVANCLKDTLRESDVIARIGGDEFVIILTNVHSEDLPKIANKLLSAFRFGFNLGLEAELKINVSLGISEYPKEGLGLDELMRKADLALYQAKQAGKNQYQIFR